MTYQIDLSRLSNITDDTPCLKREPPASYKDSTDFYDANSTLCEYADEKQGYSFRLQFQVEIDETREPIRDSQIQMGSSFGIERNSDSNIKVLRKSACTQTLPRKKRAYTKHHIYVETMQQLKKGFVKKVVKKKKWAVTYATLQQILLILLLSSLFGYVRGYF